ncbi:hypothetical protein Dda_0280 [Drechslerella dactyloides]|uniref:MARVEL domain-containing protein n=1 Tax=Drechslerella dactyloides TaxID=74499 RepID=A0AAD6J472_DREDA|nr:hypothetical protein Dda_0280 [Drechslerella dactyloides]
MHRINKAPNNKRRIPASIPLPFLLSLFRIPSAAPASSSDFHLSFIFLAPVDTSRYSHIYADTPADIDRPQHLVLPFLAYVPRPTTLVPHPTMAFSPILGIRIAQAILSIIVLGLDAYSITAFNNTLRGSSPSSMNFVIFCCIWTWLSLVYILVVPRFLPRLHDKFIILGVEVLANIFWFSGFVAVAAYVGDHNISCPEAVCGSIKATIAFSCFEWLAWLASLVLVCLSIFKGRNMLGALPMMEAQHAPLNMGVESSYPGAGGYDPSITAAGTPMGFNPMETPAPYSATNTPAPYDPHHIQPAHLQPQDTGGYDFRERARRIGGIVDDDAEDEEKIRWFPYDGYIL